MPSNSRWTILGEAGRIGRKISYHVECSCVSKTKRVVVGVDLTSGQSRSCGCYGREVSSGYKKFPVLPADCRWRILREAGRDKTKHVLYEVECGCGSKIRRIIRGSLLSRGIRRSCGCIWQLTRRPGVMMSNALASYGHLMNPTKSLDRLDREVRACDSASSTRKRKQTPTRS